MQSNEGRRLYFEEYIEFGRYAIYAAGMVHALFLFIFYYLNVFPLVVINIFSLLLYAFCLKVLDSSVENNNYALIGWLVHIELMGHAVIACYYIGTDSGFHYYIVLLPALPFLMFNDAKTVKVAKIASVIIAFTLLDIAMKNYAPPYLIEEVYSTAFRFFNVTAFLSSTIIITLFYTKITISVRQQLEYASTTDKLTGLYNRHLFTNLAEIEMKNLHRNKSILSMIILDIDDFKKINDLYGHNCGDVALMLIADALHQAVRPKDIVSRWGGEEFIILLPNTDLEDAAVVAERLRQSISSQSVVCHDYEFTLTATLGLAASSNFDDSLDKLIEQADRALYIGKANGKNQFVVSD